MNWAGREQLMLEVRSVGHFDRTSPALSKTANYVEILWKPLFRFDDDDAADKMTTTDTDHSDDRQIS